MTATTATPESQPRVTGVRSIASEWVKLRSLRSTWWSLGVAMTLAIGLGVLSAYLGGDQRYSAPGTSSEPIATSLVGFYVALIAVGALGVLFVTGEYSTGMIRATLCAVPRRTEAWFAKLFVFAGVIFPATLAAAFLAFVSGQGVLGHYHVRGSYFDGGRAFASDPNGQVHRLGVSLTHPGALRAIVCTALFMVGVGLLGMGLGFIVRNTAGACAILFGLLFVPPLLSETALPFSIQYHVMSYLPLIAGAAGMKIQYSSSDLNPWVGLGILSIYVIAALGTGLAVLRRRDA